MVSRGCWYLLPELVLILGVGIQLAIRNMARFPFANVLHNVVSNIFSSIFANADNFEEFLEDQVTIRLIELVFVLTLESGSRFDA